MKQIKRIIVHWAVAPWKWGIEDIRKIHVEQNGWPRIAYHRIILHECSRDIVVPDHSKLKLMDLVKATINIDDDDFLESNEIGYHSAEMNSSSLGICLVCGPKNPPSSLQKTALIHTLEILRERFDIEIDAVFGHRDFGLNTDKGLALGDDFELTDKAKRLNTTECPGDELYALIQNYKKGGGVNA